MSVIGLAFAGGACFVKGQPPPPAAVAFQKYAKETAAQYEAHAGSDRNRPLKLRSEAILRWSNPLGGRQAHGDVFLWLDQGRPAAVLSLYQYTDPEGAVHEHHEFCSVAEEPLHFTAPPTRLWSPPSGLRPQVLLDAPAPAESTSLRLRQMRELAARFTAEKTTREGITRPLRLLPQPVHRYETTLAKFLDGAMFAFVEATDPDVFLLIEARFVQGQPQWYYALARMNSVGLRVSLRQRIVWEASVLRGNETFNRPDRPYTAFEIR